MRLEKLSRLEGVLHELEEEKLSFSGASVRQKNDHWRKESNVFVSYLEKIVGSDKQEQAAYLLYQLRRLYPQGSHISVCVDDFKEMKDFSTLSKDGRKRRAPTYRAFDNLLSKMSGSGDRATHTKFLNLRFAAIHQMEEDYQPLVLPTRSWETVLKVMTALRVEDGEVLFSQKTDEQLNRPSCKTRHMILKKLMVICAGSKAVGELENLMDHECKAFSPGKELYLWDRLCRFVDKLEPLKQFDSTEQMLKKYRVKYHNMKSLINKTCGYDNSMNAGRRARNARCEFLKHLFPKTFKVTWRDLLEENNKNWSSLKEKPTSQRKPIAKALLNLIKKFMGASEIDGFFEEYCKKLKTTHRDPIMKRLQELANSIEQEIGRRKSQSGNYNIRFLSHLYTNVLACIVSPTEKEFTHGQLKTEGWKFGKDRYTTARKRQLEETFTEVQPKKRGKVSIPEVIKQKIVEE